MRPADEKGSPAGRERRPGRLAPPAAQELRGPLAGPRERAVRMTHRRDDELADPGVDGGQDLARGRRPARRGSRSPRPRCTRSRAAPRCRAGAGPRLRPRCRARSRPGRRPGPPAGAARRPGRSSLPGRVPGTTTSAATVNSRAGGPGGRPYRATHPSPCSRRSASSSSTSSPDGSARHPATVDTATTRPPRRMTSRATPPPTLPKPSMAAERPSQPQPHSAPSAASAAAATP